MDTESIRNAKYSPISAIGMQVSSINWGIKMDSDLELLQPKLTDKQWSLIRDLFPEKPIGPKGGRPPAKSCACLKAFFGCFEVVSVG